MRTPADLWTSTPCAESRHRHCTSCPGCTCHLTKAPTNFRELVQRASDAQTQENEQ